MSCVTVIDGTGYAGAAIVAEAAGRGHRVTFLSQRVPASPVSGVTYVQRCVRRPHSAFGDRRGRGRGEPEIGDALPAQDYALGLVDLIEDGSHHRAQVNIGNPV